MKKRTWVLAAVGAVMAIGIGTAVVLAQTDEDGAGTPFLDRVAQKLGIQRDSLDQAIRDARSDEIDEAVANGDLTQKRADELKQHLDEMPTGVPFLGPGPAFGDGLRFHGAGAFGLELKFGFPGGIVSAELAEFLGITEDQLRDELQADGATLATVAEAHGKSREDLKAFIVDRARTKLAGAVTNGDLPQERADKIIARLEENLDEFIDGELPPHVFPGEGGFGFGMQFGPGGFGLGLFCPGIGQVAPDIAEFLGIDEQQLADELQADGASLASVAEAHGKTRDELRAFIIGQAKTKLDEAVANQDLTQKRADEILAGFEEHVEKLIDGQFPRFPDGFKPPLPFEWERGAPNQQGIDELAPAFRS